MLCKLLSLTYYSTRHHVFAKLKRERHMAQELAVWKVLLKNEWLEFFSTAQKGLDYLISFLNNYTNLWDKTHFIP